MKPGVAVSVGKARTPEILGDQLSVRNGKELGAEDDVKDAPNCWLVITPLSRTAMIAQLISLSRASCVQVHERFVV